MKKITVKRFELILLNTALSTPMNLPDLMKQFNYMDCWRMNPVALENKVRNYAMGV